MSPNQKLRIVLRPLADEELEEAVRRIVHALPRGAVSLRPRGPELAEEGRNRLA